MNLFLVSMILSANFKSLMVSSVRDSLSNVSSMGACLDNTAAIGAYEDPGQWTGAAPETNEAHINDLQLVVQLVYSKQHQL